MQKRILLLDRDGDLLQLADEMMYYGYSDVHITADSNAVYELAKDCRPDVIILDLLLSDGDVADVCRHIKQDDSFKGVPVILISATNGKNPDLDEYCPDAFFIKPLDTEILASKINYLIAS